MSGPLTIQCPRCGGYGMVSHYSATDFEGAMECPDCAGGSLVVYESDRLALYPGGPMRGSWPGRYSQAVADLRRGTEPEAESNQETTTGVSTREGI